eukprot:480343-Hanusia_phi.AAC.3
MRTVGRAALLAIIASIVSLAAPPRCQAYFTSISDQSMPVLVTPAGMQRFNWVRGDLHQILRSSHGVRINERGIQVIHSPTVQLGGWQTVPCRPDPSCLCTTDGGGRFFPVDRVSISGNVSGVVPILRPIAEVGCRSAGAGRTLVDPSTTYDVSVCDVVDGRLDTFWDGGTLYYRRTQTPMWVYLCVGAVCVYLVSCIAQNLTTLLVVHKEHMPAPAPETPWRWVARAFEVGVVAFTLLYSLVTAWIDRGILLSEEFDYTVLALTYVVAHFLAMSFKVLTTDAASRVEHFLTFNLNTGVLLLLTLAVYKTLANPYVGILLVMLTLRTFYKLLDLNVGRWSHDEKINSSYLHIEVLLTALDTVLLVATHYIGFRRSFLFPFDADASFVVVCLFSWFVAEFVIKD